MRRQHVGNHVALVAAWHFVWLLLLIPSVLFAASILLGPQRMQDIEYGLTQGFTAWVLIGLVALPMSMLLGLIAWFLPITRRGLRAVVITALSALGWAVFATTFLPSPDSGYLRSLAIGAALAGVAYGVVVSFFPRRRRY